MTPPSPFNGSIWSVVMRYGVAGVIAIYAVYIGGEYLIKYIPRIWETVESNAKSIEEVQEQHTEIRRVIEHDGENKKMRDEMMIKLMRASCLNEADTRDERSLCNP